MIFGRKKAKAQESEKKPQKRMPVFDNSNPDEAPIEENTALEEADPAEAMTPEQLEEVSRAAMQDMIRIGNRHLKNIDEFIEEAVPFVQKKNNWIYYRVFGGYMQQLGRYWEATEGFKMAAEKAPAAELPGLYNLVGQTYFMWNSKEHAEEYRNKAIEYLKKAGDFAESLNVLGCIYDPNFKDTYYEKDADTALSYYYKAWRAYRKRDSEAAEAESTVRDDLARIGNNIGVIYGTDKGQSLTAAAFAQAVFSLDPDNKTYIQNQKTYWKYVKKHYPQMLSDIEKIKSVEEAEQFHQAHTREEQDES